MNGCQQFVYQLSSCRTLSVGSSRRIVKRIVTWDYQLFGSKKATHEILTVFLRRTKQTGVRIKIRSVSDLLRPVGDRRASASLAVAQRRRTATRGGGAPRGPRKEGVHAD